jgi:hypothetical protein
MIDMGMGEKKGTHLLGIKSPIHPVPALHLSSALKKTAIHQHLLPLRRFNEIIGTCYRPGTTKTNHSDHHSLLSLNA